MKVIYKATDGSADSITVDLVNDEPVADEKSVSTNEDTDYGARAAAVKIYRWS